MLSSVRLLFFILALPSASPLPTLYYDVSDIGGGATHALAINNYSEVVGQVVDGLTARHAFYWSASAGFSSLGGYCGWDINDIGQIAGASGELQAAVWENGSWIDLENRQYATAINEQSHVTGLISAQPSIPGPYAPFRDTDIYTSGFTVLQRPYALASHGLDINNSGQIVADCGSTAPGRRYVAVLYEADDTYTILNSGTCYDTHPRAINDSGQIAGYSQQSSSSNRFPAFWPSPSSPMQSMGNLGVGDGFAWGMNNLGEAVGSSCGRAFRWSAALGMLDLNDQIDPALGITLTRALDINDAGSIIAWGNDALGVEHSYLLTPEPACIILIAAGFLASGRGSRQVR